MLGRRAPLVAGIVAVADRHRRVDPARASRRLSLAHGAARAAPDGRDLHSARAARERRLHSPVPRWLNIAPAGARRCRCSRCSSNCCACASSTPGASALRRRRSRRAADPRRALERLRQSPSSGGRAVVERGQRPLARSAGLAARLAAEAEALQPGDLALAFDARRVPGAAGPAIRFAMRLRSCSAKCGVEAPISWRTSSTRDLAGASACALTRSGPRPGSFCVGRGQFDSA